MKQICNKAQSCAFFIMGFLCLCNLAQAQTIPEGATAASEENRLRKRMLEDKLTPKARQPLIRRAQPAAGELPAEADQEFLVQKIEIKGNTLVSLDEIRKVVSPYENQRQSLRKLIAIADLITELYQSKGFISSQAFVPPQKIENNTVILHVVEGLIGSVSVKGNKYFRTSIIERGLKRFKGKALDYMRLAKELIYLNQHHDRQVQAVVEPGVEKGTSDIAVEVRDTFPAHGSYEFNNLGTGYTGRLRHGITARYNNFSGFDDSMAFTYQTSEQASAFSAYVMQYVLPLAFAYERRTKLDVLCTYVTTDLLKEFKESDVEAYSSSVLVNFSQEFFNSLRARGMYSFGFEARSAKTKQRGAIINKDKLRTLRAAVVLEEYDRWGRMGLTNEFKVGFADFLDSSPQNNPDAARAGSGGEFYKYTFGLSRINRITPQIQLLCNVEAQYNIHKLSTLEHMSIGGVYSVRGYPEGEASGDYGVLAIAELRTPLIAGNVQVFNRDLNKHCQLAFFVDTGYVHLQGAEPAIRDRSLTGAGAGLRLTLNDYSYGRFDIAWPVGENSFEGRRNPRLYYSLTFGF